MIKTIPNIKHTESGNFFLLAGPCAIEGEEIAMQIAERIVEITNKLEIPLIFKGSYRKANRSRLDSFAGIGDEKALKILKKVSDTFRVPTVTDIHSAEEAAMAAEYVDVLQIPAFLCRQTDLLVAAAKTGKVVNIKNENNLLQALKKLGMELKPIYCGGTKEPWNQEREQWHSGANFFAVGPGKVVGYARNIYTMEEMNKNGFDIIPADDVINHKVNLAEYDKYVITLEGSELPRGGGGARCMTMPIRRKSVNW